MKGVIYGWMLLLLLAGCRPAASELLSYSDPASGRCKPVRTPQEWDIRRGQLLDSLQAAMGALPSRSQLPPFDVQYLDSLNDAACTRYSVRFTVAEGEELPALLYVPLSADAARPCPAMLALHPTGAAGKRIPDGENEYRLPYARELAQRGYVVIAPDYPGFGDLSDFDFRHSRYASGSMKGVFDHIRCVDWLQTMEAVDADRIGVIGHSLGGHNALFVAAFDTRLKAVVSSCGWTEFEYYNIGTEASEVYGGRLGPWAQDRYMPLLRDRYGLKRTPFNFHDVIALIAPRALYSCSPLHDANFDVKGVEAGIDRALEVYRFLNAEAALRVSYPDAKHDFPMENRLETYEWLDRIFHHNQ
ncbi:MAG: alpha/beta fold hydrolase [Tannerella sp.]|jgi:acetyl esterase/lipase|nr:alpha/beta fold hydrolase [Tannerella sp.]